MPTTADTTIIAAALRQARALARQAMTDHRRPVREMASDLEVSLNDGLQALARIEAAVPIKIDGKIVGFIDPSAEHLFSEPAPLYSIGPANHD